MDLISCHRFNRKPNSTVVLVCHSRLVNCYLEKGSVILEQKSNQLSSFSNYVRLRIHFINKQKQIILWRTTEKFPLLKKP